MAAAPHDGLPRRQDHLYAPTASGDGRSPHHR
jgi:hypothetical protein